MDCRQVLAEQQDKANEAAQLKQQEYQQLVVAAQEQRSVGRALELQTHLAHLHQQCRLVCQLTVACHTALPDLCVALIAVVYFQQLW